MKTIIAALITIVSVQSFADGFVCESNSGDLNVKVYNKVNATEGTRTAAVMIVSDPNVNSGRKTIAKFSSENGTLTTTHNQSLKYTGDVDLRFTDSSRSGEYLVGTRLGEVDTINLTIDFAYGDNLVSGDQVSGRIVVLTREGESIVRHATCTRYLKGE